jgi:hypothetical protein
MISHPKVERHMNLCEDRAPKKKKKIVAVDIVLTTR